uniref:Rev3l_4 protein n=1 Tax=Fopius arisanus TaxID=64838 RepID=A0A0C9RL77_9HYME
MFSVRLVTADSYQAQPLPQLDPTFSVFRGSEIKNVPVIRVFGTTPTGEKTCLHVHGVFPYLYVPYTGEENEDRLAYRLAASLDAAINISLGSANSTTQHVYQIQRVAGIPFYGYHKREHQFFKISFYNPAIMKKAADLLQTGAVLGQSLQPHEAHLNYTLQFMMDYNLYGMSFINLSSVKHRRGNESTVDMITSYDSVITPVDNVEYLPVNVLRQSICELEIDAIASDILNREDLAKGIELNPGLLAIWNEERERRKQAGLGGGDTQLVNPKSPQRPPFRPTDSDLYQEQRLARRLLMLSQADESTLSMSTNPAPYPAEVTQGDVILNASNFGSLSIPTSDKTQRPNETLSLSSLGSTHSSQTSHECSVLDSDDLPLVELLENLARDSNTKETVDEDSVLGTQVSSLSQEEDKSEDDSCTNEDLNLTCLELDSWSSWEGGRRPTTLESPHKCSLTDDEMDSTLLGALLAAGIDTDPSSPQSLESSVPQLDGAGDLCSSLLDSEEEENLQMEVGHNSQMTKIAVCSQVTPSNSSLSPSTSSSASEGTSQDSWGLKYSPITYEHLTDDLVDDIENMMHENLMLEMNFTNEEVPVGVSLVEDETIPIERVLNGDPCFTETAELDKSDLTELQDQYVSLLDRQLLSEIYENSQNLDLINNTATEDTGNCQVGGQGIDFVQAECVIQNVQETHRELCKQNTGIDASAVDENCEQVNRHTSDSSDYNCNVVATWEELHDFPYLPKGIIKRKCTQKLSNQGIERRKSKVTAKSEVQSCSGEVCEGPREPVEGNTLGSLKIQGNQLRENLMDVRVFPRVQYSPYLLGENETLVAPILADFEELTEPLSPGDVPLTSNYCSDRSHRGIIFGEDQHRHCVYSFNHRKFVQDYVFTSNEIWVIEKRKRGKAGTGSVITSKLCNRECRLPCVLLEKINIEESEEQGENIEVVKDLDSISSALPPDDSARNDLDYCTPGVDSIDVDVSVDDTRKERNTFTRITRQSERNFIQSQSSTESGDGPVIIRRVFEEKTSGSTCVKKRKIILKVGSNTDSQSDDSRVEDKSKVSLKTRRKLRRVKDKVPANMAVEDSQELENEINGSASVGDVQCIRQVLPVVESLKSTSRPRIVCSIKTKRLGMKWLLSLTSKHPRKINQMVQSKLPTPQPQIRKVETITQRYKLRVRRREPEGKSIVEPVEDEKVEATTCHVTAEVEVNNSPVLAGLIHGVDVAKGESEEIEPSVSGDKIPVTNDETTPVYTNTVAEVNLYSGKDYTIDAVSQEIPQLLFAEDSNASFNENTINMMSLKRSVDEIEANSTADQSENFSVKSFDGDEYSDHESGILSMADDSGSNGTLNNDVGDSANSPSSFRALLINELQKGKRCERCERCDCNSYMSMLTMSTEGPRTGSLRSEKIFLQEEKMSLVTKSIFRLIGDDTQLNTNTGRGLIENSPDSEDDTLKDVSDKNLDSDFPSEERFSSTPKSSPKSSPKKISILRRIYSSNSEPLHCDEIQGEARGHRGKIFVEDEGSGNHQSSDMNGVQLDCNLSAIDEYKTLSQGDCRDAGGQCLRPLGGVEEGSEVRRQRESYLEVVLEEDHNGELIMGTGEWGNSGKTLSCTETGTGERFNGECGGDSKTTSTAVLADYNYKSGEGTSGDIAGDVARERLSGVENGEMCLSRVEASDGGNLVSIGDDRCTKCLAISQSAVLEKIVEPTVENLAIRSSELIDIDENTQDTFILDTRSDEIETCVQNTIRGIDELSLADTIIMDPSPDNSRDNNDEPLLVDGILGDERSCVMEDKQLSEDAITGDFNSANQVSVVDKNSTDAESIGEGIGEEFGMGNGEIGFDGITMVEKNTGESTNLPSENTRDSELRFVEYIEETVVIEEMRESRITDDDDVAGHSTGGVGVEEAGQREKVFVDDNDTAGISAIVQRETDKDSLSGVGDDDASGVHSTVEKESQKVIEQFIDDNDTIKASIVEKESQGPAESKAVLANDNDNPQVVNQNLPSEQSESPEEYLKADGGDNEDSEALSATGEKVEENLKDDDYSETIDQNNSCPDVPEVQVEPEVRTDSSNIYPITQDPPDLTSLKNSEEGHELSSLNDNEEIEFFNSPETSEDETINVIINNLDHDEEVEESSSTSNKIIPMPVRPNDVTESTEPPEPTENVIALVNRIKHSTETLPNELITLPPDLPTTEVPVPFPKCSRLFVKLERLNADLVAKYLKSLPQKSKEEMPQLKIKKRVRFSSEIIYFGSDEIRPLKDIPDEEYTDTTETALSCVDEPETEETSEVLDKLAIETSQTSTEWKVDGGTPRKDSNTALTRKKSRDSDEDEPKCHKRVKVAEIQPEIIQSETSNPPEIKEENASESTDDLPEIVYDSRSAANSEQQKNVISRSFPQLINVIEVIDVPSDTRDSRQRSVFPPGVMSEVISERILEAEASLLPSESIPRLEFTRMSKMPSKRSRSPSSSIPSVVSIISPQSLESSIFDDIHPAHCNRYVNTYVIQSAYRTKYHTVSVDKRLALTQITTRDSKLRARSSKERFLVQLGLYPLNPNLQENWVVEDRHVAYIQRQEPRVMLHRLNAPTLKRYGYNHRFKSNRSGKRFLNGNDFKIPAYDGPADLTSSDSETSDNETDITVEEREKRVCSYKSIRNKERLTTPSKRKHPESLEESPVAVKCLRTTPKRTPSRPSMLKSPGRLSGNYTPLKIIVTSPKVRREASDTTEQLTIDADDGASAYCLTPRRREQGLHENLLRGRISQATPIQRSGKISS